MTDIISSSPRSRLLQWLSEFDLANPWTEPIWFLEDVKDNVVYFMEDYFFCSPVFWAFWYTLLAYIAIRTPIRIVLYLRRDYLLYLSLGRGGRPSTVRGWLTNKWYQFLLVDIIGVDVLSTPRIDPYQVPYTGKIFDMPERKGPRPEIIGIGPLIQKTGGSPGDTAWIKECLRFLALSRPYEFIFCLSAITGLPTLKRNILYAMGSETFDTEAEWGGEVAHVRHDGSMTMRLHPWDAAEVIRCGWGQRNPLAVMNDFWIWRFFFHRVLRTNTPLPSTSVIVYSPVDSEQMAVVERILMAAFWWANDQRYE